MFKCPACSKANNVYATVCQHCGSLLTPEAAPEAPKHPPCTKCGHGQWLAISPFTLVDSYRDRIGVMPVLVTQAAAEPVGSFRALVCLGCGFTEWYALGLEKLVANAAKAPNAQVIEATVPPAYR